MIFGWGELCQKLLSSLDTKWEKVHKTISKYNKFYTNSVGKPTDGNLGLVREKRGGREVGTIAYPDLLWVGGREKKSG